jgi:hypothetical protein
MLPNLEVKRDERNRWNIYINGINSGIIETFVQLIRIEAEIDY